MLHTLRWLCISSGKAGWPWVEWSSGEWLTLGPRVDTRELPCIFSTAISAVPQEMMNFLRSSGWIRQKAFNPEIQHFARKCWFVSLPLSPPPPAFCLRAVTECEVAWTESFSVLPRDGCGKSWCKMCKMGWQSDTEEHHESASGTSCSDSWTTPRFSCWANSKREFSQSPREVEPSWTCMKKLHSTHKHKIIQILFPGDLGSFPFQHTQTSG